MTQENPGDVGAPPPAPPPPVTPSPSDPSAPVGTGAFGAPAPGPSASTSEERTWGMLCHLAGLAGLIGIPLGSIIGPLIIWLIKKDQMPFVNDQGKESLNFQITVHLIAIPCAALICVAGLGFFLLIALGIAALVFIIIASMEAHKGVAYRYPWALRLIK